MKTEDFKKDVKLAVKGDCEAFSKLYALVYEDLYHVAFYSLRNQHDASDVVSDTVLEAYSSIHNLRNEDSFKSWIFKILSVKIKKKQAEYYNSTSSIDDITEYEETLKKTFDFEHLEIAEAMYEIEDTERLILSLSVLEGYSSKEISKICGINDATIRSKLARTKEKLRKYLTI